MKIIEPIFLCSWLICIFLYQFHDPSKNILKKRSRLGFFPSFHLFSPKPFLGRYIIRYTVYGKKNTALTNEVKYAESSGFLDSDKRIVKCINNLCRNLSKSTTGNNYQILLNFIKTDAEKKLYKGKIQFSVFVEYRGKETLKFNSKTHALSL